MLVNLNKWWGAMTKARCLGVSRILYRGFVKNVYKHLNYAAPFSIDEKKCILSLVNQSSSPEQLFKIGTSKAYAKKISKHMQESGPFECVEQILDVENIDETILKRICERILKAAKREDSEMEMQLQNKGVLAKSIKPNLAEESWNRVERFCGLKFNLQSVSYCEMDMNKTVLNWGHIPLLSSAPTTFGFEHFKVYALSELAVQQLPQSDLYIFEENFTSGKDPKDPNMKFKVNHLIFQSSLVTLLNSKNSTKLNPATFSSKPNILNTLFSLTIGNERKMVQSNFLELIGCKTLMLNESPKVNLSPNIYDTFIQCTNRQYKEQMCLALLVALSLHSIMQK